MNQHDEQNERWSKVGKYVFIGFALIAAYFIITEHRAHVIAFLPWVLLLACPLLHLFHGHGSHGGNHDANRSDSRGDREDPHGDRAQSHHH